MEFEKKRVKLLSKELQQSVEDELGLRSYCISLEKQLQTTGAELSSTKAKLSETEKLAQNLTQQLQTYKTNENITADELRSILAQYLMPKQAHNAHTNTTTTGSLEIPEMLKLTR